VGRRLDPVTLMEKLLLTSAGFGVADLMTSVKYPDFSNIFHIFSFFFFSLPGMGDEKWNINIAKPLTFHKGLTNYGPRHRLQKTRLKGGIKRYNIRGFIILLS